MRMFSTAKSIISTYLSLALLMGIIGVFVFSILELLNLTNGSVFEDGALPFPIQVTGFFFGALLSLITVPWHIISVKRKGFKLSEANLRVRHVRHLTLPLPYEAAFDKCVYAVQSLDIDDIELKVAIASMGRIEAKTGRSWNGWGDKITISVFKSPNEQTNVTISSKPRWWTALVDNGSNLQNVETLADCLNKKLPA